MSITNLPSRFIRWLCPFSRFLFILLLIQMSMQFVCAQNYAYAERPVEDIFFSDSSNGWIVVSESDQCYLLRTFDGGITWSKVSVPTRTYGVFFLDARIGWALALGGPIHDAPNTYLFQTRDSGKSWKRIQDKRIAGCGEQGCTVVSGMAFSDGSHGWLIGVNPGGFLWTTSNAGRSIHLVKRPELPDSPRGLYANRAGRVWIFGNQFILYSPDNGNSWRDQLASSDLLHTRPELILESGIVSESGAGWAAGQNATGTILNTRDFGDHWTVALESDQLTTFMSLSFWDSEHGCAAGTSTLLFCTADGGKAWSQRDVLPKQIGVQSPFFEKIVLLKSGRGWILRTGGFLYETLDGGQVWRALDPQRDFSIR
jgi:photosystem II stability/assembly factor-like uncharacterized protein